MLSERKKGEWHFIFFILLCASGLIHRDDLILIQFVGEISSLKPGESVEQKEKMIGEIDRDVSPSSLSIETLEEIVRNCQRNEERLHELERHTRHERKKAERLLRVATHSSRNRKSSNEETSKQFFVPLEPSDDENLVERVEKLLTNGEKRDLSSACSIEIEMSKIDRNSTERTPKSSRDEKFYDRLDNYVKTGRFNNEEKVRSRSNDEDLKDLARRCEDLLSRLHAQRQRAEILESITHVDRFPPSPIVETKRNESPIEEKQFVSAPSVSLQESLELLRPDFISRSRQRARRIRLLREERQHNAEIDREREQILLFTAAHRPASSHTAQRNVSFFVPTERSASARVPLTHREIKQATKKKYQQLPEVNDQRRKAQLEENRRRNLLRAKLFRSRLRQHVIRYGRTNIDESLTIVDT